MKVSYVIAFLAAAFTQVAHAQAPCLVDFFGEFTVNANRIVSIHACTSRSCPGLDYVAIGDTGLVILTDNRRLVSKSTSVRDAEQRIVALKEMIRQQCGAK